MPDKLPALGRGLSALIPDMPPVPSVPLEVPNEIDIDRLEPNQEQVRREMDEAKLEELARSIKASGVIQPILVRPQGGGRYEIVAGERRWRAAQRAGLMKVPVVVRDVPDNKRLELALIENIQREDLNPIDEASAYRRLADEFQLTQEEIAGAVGKDRATVANYLRLLTLSSEVRAEVASGMLSMGHARALVGLEDASVQRRTARDVRARDLSVRETEALVRKLIATAPPRKASPPVDAHTKDAEEQLRLSLGTRVKIIRRGTGGRLEIGFGSEAELQRLYELLTARPVSPVD